MNSRNHKRYLAALIAMSMLVSFMVPFLLIEPAVSMTKDSGIKVLSAAGNMIPNFVGENGTEGNDGYSKAQLSDIDLLIGEGSPLAEGASSASDVITNARNKYFLGIASDFCVFLEGDFKPTAADAEGRVVVGGDIDAKQVWEGGGAKVYQIGAGDFGNDKTLDATTNYLGYKNYAHAIVGGNIKGVATFGTKTEGKTMIAKDGTNEEKEQNAYKRFAVSPNFQFDITSHADSDEAEDVYKNGCDHWGKAFEEEKQFYKSTLIDIQEEYNYIKGQSEKLSRIKGIEITEFDISNDTVTFDAGEGCTDEVVYFNVDASLIDSFAGKTFQFKNIPELEGQLISEKAGAGPFQNIANIVINVTGSNNGSEKTIDFGLNSGSDITHTYINGTQVSNTNTGDKGTNNHPYSEKLLYNFYEAETIYMNSNFNGTILAPNANVYGSYLNEDGTLKDESCHGHLSGSLIAKSFAGGTEFGYRPYRGTVDILGSQAGYVVPFDKFITGTAEHLPGASFEVKDESDNTVASWTSGDKTQYVAIPTGVDFTGGVNYSNSTPIEHTYTVKESKAPTGYHPSDKTYTVKVTENVNTNYLIPVDGKGTIPQVVDVNVEISSNGEETTTFNFQIRDVYSDNDSSTDLKPVQRQVIFNDIVYVLNINNGTVTSVGTTEINNIAELTTSTETQDITPEEQDSDNEQNVPHENVDSDTEPTETASDNNTENSEPVQESSEVPPAQPSSESSPSDEESVGLTKIDTITPVLDENGCKTSGKIGETNYYYDNKSIIVMPLPSNTPTFENKPGLLFAKVDETTGEILEEAEISIVPIVDDFSNDVKAKGSFLFDIESLTENQVYTLTEGNPPPNYEKKDEPIYLQKRDGKLYYGETNPPKTEIVKNDNGYYSFSMEDIKISGAKIKLGKWKSDYSTRLKGAKFQLQASSDKTVIYPLPATVKDTDNNDVPNTFTIPADKDFDLYTTLKNADPSTYDTNYIQNGYLKPGQYTLHEVEAPEGNYQPQDFQFRVKNDNSIEVIPSGTPEYFKAKITDKGSGNGSSGPKQIGIQVINKTDEEISVTNVTKVEIELNSPDSGTIIAYDDGISCPLNNKTTSISNGLAVFDNLNNISLSKFKLQNNSYDIGLDIKEVRIYGEEGESSGGGGNNTPPSAEITIRKTDSECAFGNWWENFSNPHEKSGASTHIQDIIFQNANDSFKNAKFDITFTYSDGTTNKRSNAIVNGDRIDINGLNQDNVTGVKIEIVTSQETTSSSESDTPETTTTADNELLDLELDEENGVIKIPNQKPGTNIKITAQKEWANDTGFESLRPESISVTLKRKLPNGTVDNSFNDAKTLTSPDWKAEWSVPRLVDENGADAESNQYKYYVEENVTSNSYYDVSYSDNNEPGLSTAGTITITNTLQKDEISITKKWVVPEGVTSPVKPNHLNVTLKFTVNGTQQTKTVTLTPKDGSEDYTGSYEIPKGATDVSVEENSVPTGWKKQSVNSDKKTGFIITNVPDTTQLTVKKEWVNDTQSSRPQQIHFKLYRKVQSGGSSGDNADAPNFDPNDTDNLYPKNQTPEQVQEDYARLLQYSLYFYDANMCGSEVSEKSAFSKTNANGWRDDCHTYSGYVDGGYHDAGDHVMFGLPQGFTASTLGWSYYEFKDSYDTLGLTEHYKTIMKYFCDFFEKSIRTRNNTVEILVQKGDSSTDHNYWGAPETQSNYGSEIWVSDKGGNIAAQYAAALAQYSLNFPDDANSTSYLSKAIEFYNFATSHTTDYDVSNYDSKESADDIAWAAGWLYLATGKNNNDYLDKLNSCPNIDWLYNWNNVAMGAACLKAEINGDWSTVNSAIDSNFKNCNAKVGNYICLNDWGSARYSTLMQFVALVSDKNNNTETYKELCQGQMAYLLGDNSIESNGNTSTCFVTGFAPNSAKYPHHRAASGTSEAKTDKTKYQHQLVGALVGGPNTSGKYIDITDNGSDLCYQVNEVALDYNAGLVGAAAGLYAAYGTGETYSNVPPAQKLRTKVGPMKLNFNVNVNVLDAADKNFIELTSDQINKLGNGLDISSLCNGKFITKISIQFNNSGGCNVTLNDCQLHNGNFTENPLEICSNDNGKFEGCYGGEVDNSTLNTLKISGWGQTVTSVKLYYKVNEFQITSSKDIIIPVDDDRTITANSKIASWSPTDNSNITITRKSDTELNVHANSYTDQQPITITLTGEDGNTDTVDVRIQGSDFEVSDAKIRIGGTPLTVDGTLTITEGSEFISIKGNTITAVSEGTAKVNVTKDGVTKPMTIEVFGVFSADTMTINKGKTKDPKINNLIGELELTILESTPEVEGTTVLEITEDGKIKTLNNGTVRIKVEDSFDNSEAEFTVTVKLTSELSELPADLNRTDDFVCEITLTKDDDWQQVLNLEKDDGNGHVYEYYVVEVNEKGDISDTNLIYGNNSVKYYPFDYDNNGATLNNGDQTITVKNEASEKPDNPDYTLPNTGGIGTGGFTTAGGAIIIGSTALYILSKRRRKKNVVR